MRIFDCRWLEKHVADRSRIVARTQKGSVMSLCCIDTSHSLGVATDGTVVICDCLFSLLTCSVCIFVFGLKVVHCC